MGGVNETISNINSAIRNVLLALLVGGAGFGGYKAYELYNEPQQKLQEKETELAAKAKELDQANKSLAARQQEIAELGNQLAAKSAEVDRLEISLKLLKVRHRLARVRVLEQNEVASLNPAAPSEGTQFQPSRPNVQTKIEFAEIDEKGQPIGQPRQFEIEGDMVYVDYLRITFDDQYIEQADLDRSTAIALFQRIFGEHQEPSHGYRIDEVGARPAAYARGAEASEFERKLWDDFWLIANDPARASELGIHSASGTAVAMRVAPGKTYEIDLRSTGEISFRPVEPPVPKLLTPAMN